ncbi:CAP domain-containing protein [Streptomyces sp. NPDC086787]|uniref:CAP domain-containing protein n=1 Tax=Streptomyces sp. NPDC086787 TaxID=3365759 RepID=UPI0037FE3A0D
MSELVPGGNLPLPGGALTLRVPGPFDVCALVTGATGRVGGDADFVFYNQPSAPGVRLRGDTLTLEPAALRPGAVRVTVAVGPERPGTPMPMAVLHIADERGRTVARFAPARPQRETVVLLAEIYRRDAGWKLRAIGQGYADGLAGLARDFGVDIAEDPPAAPAAAGRAGIPGQRSAPPAPGHSAGRASGTVPAPDPEGVLGLVNSARARTGAPPVVFDARLVAAARAHATAMADAGRLSGESRDGVSVHQRITATGFTYVTVGEHLVSGPRTPAEFVDYCLRTEQARRTLQDPAFTHAGLAHVSAARTGDTFWTALWARPLGPDDLDRTRAEVVRLTNAERRAAGLPPLAADPLLAAAAQGHSADMAARDFYSHTSPEGSEPWDRAAAAGAARRSIGENIACGQRSAAEVVDGWMNSPGHRANILKPSFTHIGVGFAGGGRAGTYWTQLFGA